MKKIIFLTVSFLLSIIYAFGDHIIGAEMTYKHAGGNNYTFTLKVFRYCDARFPAKPYYKIEYGSVSCNKQGVVELDLVDPLGNEISPICPSQISTCGGNTSPNAPKGVKEYVYQKTVTLPDQCTDWVFSFVETSDFRNSTINTIENPGGQNLYIEARLNNKLAPNNSSPSFETNPVAFMNINQNNPLNPGAVDANGDELVFKTVTPKTGKAANAVVKYLAPYSASNPITSSPAFSFNETNGAINATPTKKENGVMAVLVEEYNSQGQFVGSVMRDIQIITQDVTNQIPLVSGIDSIQGKNSIEVCSGEQVCFNLFGTDPDNQEVSFDYRGTRAGLIGATVTDSYDEDKKYLKSTICWTPPVTASGSFPFVVEARDDNCPEAGVAQISFEVIVNPSPVAKMPNDTNIACTTIPVKPKITGGTAPFTYKWNTGETTESITKGSGFYYLSIIDAKGCKFNPRPNPADTTVIKSSITPKFKYTKTCQAESILFEDVSTSTGGKIEKWSWDFGEPSSGGSNFASTKTPSHKYSEPGVYAVRLQVTDASDCKATIIDSVRVCDMPIVDFEIEDSCKHKNLQFVDKVSVKYCGLKEYKITARKGNGPETILHWELFPNILHPSLYYPQKEVLDFPITVADTGDITFKVTVVNEYDCVNSFERTYKIYDNPHISLDQPGLLFLKCNDPVVELSYKIKTYDANGKYEGTPYIKKITGQPDSAYYKVYWPDGSSGKTYNADKVGKFGVRIVDRYGCDTIDVTEIKYPITTNFGFTKYCNNNDSREFTDTTRTVYKIKDLTWKMGTDTTIIIAGKGNHTLKYNFKQSGTYPVQLIARDEFDCADTAQYFAVQEMLDKHFIVTPDSQCAGKLFTIESPKGSTVDSIAWNYGNGKTDKIKKSQLQKRNGIYYYNPTSNKYNSTNDAGKTYNVSVSVIYNVDTLNNTRCIFDTSKAITIHPLFRPSIVTDGSCLGNSTDFGTNIQNTPKVKWDWKIYSEDHDHSGGNGTHRHIIDSSKSNSGTITLEKEGRYFFNLSAVDSNGCSYSTEREHFVAEMPKPDFCPENLCADTRIDFFYLCNTKPKEGFSIDSVYWHFDDPFATQESNTSDLQAPFHIYKKEGTYNVTVKIFNDTYKCSDSITKPLTVQPLPIPGFATSSPVCAGNPVIMYDTSKTINTEAILSRYWRYGDGDSAFFDNSGNHEHLFKEPGIYNVQLIIQSASACVDTAEVAVEVFSVPTAGFTFDENELLKGSPLNIRNTSADANKWYYNYGDGRDTTIVEPGYTAHKTTIYKDSTTLTQIVFNSFGCSDTLIRKLDLNPYMIIPELFSPNGDGNNDVLTLHFKGIKEIAEFRIYNRWGELVYEGNPKNVIEKSQVSWDGIYNGREQPVGTYVYYIKATTFTGYEYSNSGKVTLIR